MFRYHTVAMQGASLKITRPKSPYTPYLDFSRKGIAEFFSLTILFSRPIQALLIHEILGLYLLPFWRSMNLCSSLKTAYAPKVPALSHHYDFMWTYAAKLVFLYHCMVLEDCSGHYCILLMYVIREIGEFVTLFSKNCKKLGKVT